MAENFPKLIKDKNSSNKHKEFQVGLIKRIYTQTYFPQEKTKEKGYILHMVKEKIYIKGTKI